MKIRFFLVTDNLINLPSSLSVSVSREVSGRICERKMLPRSVFMAFYPGGGGDSHMKQTGMLVGNFDFN